MAEAKAPSLGATKLAHKTELKEWEKRKKTHAAALKKLTGAAKQAAKQAFDKEESDMLERHARELDAFVGKTEHSEDTSTAAAAVVAAPAKPSQAEKRRAKKEQAEREMMETAARVEAEGLVGPRAAELEALQNKLRPLGRAIRVMPADGSCLFAALRDQLALAGRPIDSAREIRTIAARYMRDHAADFLAFAEMDAAQFAQYCTAMETGDDWGGQLELVAVSRALGVRVTVISADAPDVVVDAGAGDDDAPMLRVTFHRHYVSTGAHYNSAVPAETE